MAAAVSASTAEPEADPGGRALGPSDDSLLTQTESWFVRRGLPYFIQDYAAVEDVFTRALPVFAGYFVVNLMLMLTLRLTLWQRICAAAAGMVILLGVYVVRNMVRKRDAFSRPRRVNWVELALFAVVPPIVAVPARLSVHYAGLGRWRLPCIDLGVNVGVILGVYILTSALLPLARWALRRTFQELGEVFDLAVRALPLLFLFNAFLFISKDVWEFAGEMPRLRLWAIVALFAVFTMLFLLYRLPDEVQRVAAHDDRATIAEACVGTPMDGVLERVELHMGKLELDRRQKTNVLMVLFVGQMLQVVVLAFLVFFFFLGFGLISFNGEDLEEWTNTHGKLPDAYLFGHELHYYIGLNISNTLLQVAIFLSAVSAFFFSVSALTDDAYKEQFYARMNRELEMAIQVRRVYLALYEGRHRFDGDRLANSHMRLRLPMFGHDDDDPDNETRRASLADVSEDGADDGWSAPARARAAESEGPWSPAEESSSSESSPTGPPSATVPHQAGPHGATQTETRQPETRPHGAGHHRVGGAGPDRASGEGEEAVEHPAPEVEG